MPSWGDYEIYRASCIQYNNCYIQKYNAVLTTVFLCEQSLNVAIIALNKINLLYLPNQIFHNTFTQIAVLPWRYFWRWHR